MRQWGAFDGTFSLIHFYHLIVKTLSDNTEKWVAETMGWWQKYVCFIQPPYTCSNILPITESSLATKRPVPTSVDSQYGYE
jgi:hypothetical protein